MITRVPHATGLALILLLAFSAIAVPGSIYANPDYGELVRQLMTGSGEQQQEVWEFLYGCGDPRLFAAVKPWLDADDPRRRGVCAQLIAFLPQPEAKAALLKLLDDGERSVRISAVRVLAERKDSAMIGVLAGLLLDPDTNVAVAAADELAEFGAAGVEPLLAALEQEGARMPSLLRALGRMRDPRAVPVLRKYVTSPDAATAQVALRLLGHEDPVALAELLARWPAADTKLRVFILKIIRGSTDPRVDALLHTACREADRSVRIEALSALRKGDPQADAVLHAACRDADARIRSIALSKLRADDPQWPELLLAALADPDAMVRADAVSQTKEGTPEARVTDALLKLLDDPDVCHAAAERLKDMRDPRLVEPLLALMQDPAHWTAGLTVLETQSDPRAIPALLAVLSAESGEDEVLDTEGDTWNGAMATRALVRIGPPAVEPLLRLARAAEPMPRRRAAKALGALCHPKIIPALIGLLDNPDVTVRLAAIEALDRQGDMRGYEALMPLLEDNEAEVRQAAAEALAGCRDPRLIELLAKMLDERDAASRAAAAEALSYFSDPRVPPLMLRALRDKDDLVYMSALQGNGRWVTERRIVDALLTLDLSRYDDELIDRLRTADAAVVVPSLLNALKSRDAGRRAVAAEALGAFPTPEAKAALLKALTDRDEYVRDAAGTSLGAFDDPAILPGLAAMLKKTRDTATRADLIRAMRHYGRPAADVLLPLLPAPCSAQERCSIILSLGETGDQQTVEPLIAELRNVTSPCRVEAAQALRELGDARAVEPFIAVLQEADKHARPAYWFTDWWQGEDRYGVAIDALGKLKDPRAVEPLMRALANEENPSHAAGIIDSLRRIGDRRAMEAIRPYLQQAVAFDVRGGETRGIVLEAAVYAAGELGDARDAERLRELLRAHLFDMHTDPIAKDCRRALTWAVGVEEKEQVEPLLIAAFREDLLTGDPTVAAKALARLDTSRAADVLCTALLTLDNEEAVQDRPFLLGLCLGRMTQMPRARLVLMLQSDNWRARKAALAAVAIRGEAWAIPPALTALSDPHLQVRAAAAFALGRLKAKEAVPALTKALDDPYSEVRKAAKAALAAMGE